MQFRRPSPIDRLFTTPAQGRPLLDLGIISSLKLSKDLQRINSGITRWADLILGFSLDDAQKQGIEPAVVNAAFEAGALSLQAFFFKRDCVSPSIDPQHPLYGNDDKAWFVGSLVSRVATLSVVGGEPLSPPFSVQYRKDAGFYHPIRPGYAVAQTDTSNPESYSITSSEVYASAPNDSDLQSKDVPPELRAAQVLGNYADQVEEALDADLLSVRCDIASTQFSGTQDQHKHTGRLSHDSK